MSRVIAVALDPPDACQSPSCHPGVNAACLPVGPVAASGGGQVADYQCGACGAAWSTRFDRWGWPVERAAAPVAEEREAA